MAPSHASAPELQKNTLLAKVAAASLAESVSWHCDAIEVRCVPQLLGLLLQSGNEAGVGVAEDIDGDA